MSPTPYFALNEYNGRDLLLYGTVILGSLYYILTIIYTAYFHPLAHIPGPKFNAVSKIPKALSLVRGNLAHDIAALHDKYGEVVRVAPNQVSFIHPDARKDIFGYKNNKNSLHFMKDPMEYILPPNGVHSIHSTPDDAVHARQRRLLAHAFSDKALREQEPLLKSYVDLLITKLQEQIEGLDRGVVDMVKWLNFTTFDLIGDLTYGEPFECLQNGKFHPWIAIVFEWMRGSIFMVAAGQFPVLKALLMAVIPKKVLQMRQDHFNLSAAKIDRRLAMETERPDFVTYLQKEKGDQSMVLAELHSNSEILILAGSETTATALSGCLYYLCLNPHALKRLTGEIRTTMKSNDDIVFSNILSMEYIAAVLDETMRVYPPVAGDLARVAPQGGAYVAGTYIPEGTTASSLNWAITHSDKNFKDPYKFVPERWLGDERYATDRKEAHQPFSFGPRNCIGKNLAYAEMRLILAKLLWNFDIELMPESKDWWVQRTFILWEKHPLMIKLKARKV